MNINQWLDAFTIAWACKDVDAVIALFADEVEYWETPFKKLASRKELRREWDGISGQYDIQLTTKAYDSHNGKNTVVWQLIYRTADDERRELAGTYLITLNKAGLCTYFHHTGELKP